MITFRYKIDFFSPDEYKMFEYRTTPYEYKESSVWTSTCRTDNSKVMVYEQNTLDGDEEVFSIVWLPKNKGGVLKENNKISMLFTYRDIEGDSDLGKHCKYETTFEIVDDTVRLINERKYRYFYDPETNYYTFDLYEW